MRTRLDPARARLRRRQQLKKAATIVSLLLPGVLFLLGGIVYPLVQSVNVSLTDASGLLPGEFSGLDNYEKLMADKIFWTSVRNAVLLSIGYVCVSHPVAIVVAWNIRKLPERWEKAFRTLLFVPAVVNIIVLVKIWVQLYNPQYGAINLVLDTVGLGGLSQDWLSNPDTAIWAVILMAIWIGWPWSFLYDYVAVKSLPDEVFEAARIDGASGLRLHWDITRPMLLPVVSVFFATAIISAFKTMEIVFVSTDGGPVHSTQFIANYMYLRAFRTFETGYANAISVVFALLCVAVTVVFFRLTRRDITE
jgi:raffinose/stachyose/melibiose transport system permease protein